MCRGPEFQPAPLFGDAGGQKAHYGSMVARGLLREALDGDGMWIKSQLRPFGPHVAGYK